MLNNCVEFDRLGNVGLVGLRKTKKAASELSATILPHSTASFSPGRSPHFRPQKWLLGDEVILVLMVPSSQSSPFLGFHFTGSHMPAQSLAK